MNYNIQHIIIIMEAPILSLEEYLIEANSFGKGAINRTRLRSIF